MAERLPRRFLLVRDVDHSGISGTGVVAEGIEFSDGVVSLRWTTVTPTSVVFHDRGVATVEAVHGHNGATRIQWLDWPPTKHGRWDGPDVASEGNGEG